MKCLLSFIMVVFALGITVTSCNNSESSGVKIEKATDKNGKEYQSAYICPMYCKGSGSNQPGKCPACKMDYVANASKVKTNTHTHDHSGHNHNHSHGHNHGHDHSGHGHVPHDHDGDGKPDH